MQVHPSAPKIFTANFTDTTNNSTVTNNILNINFNIDNKNIKIIPFDEDWDISKFDLETKQVLLMSTIKFTKTYQETGKKPGINKNIFIIYFILYVSEYKYLFIFMGKKSQCFRAYPI